MPAEDGPSEATETPDASSRRKRWPFVVVGLLALVAFTGAFAVGSATSSYADSLAGRLLPGTAIAGVDVGGMTQDEALAAIDDELAEQLDRKIVVRWKDRRWVRTARQLGARTDAEQMVAEVAASQTGLTWRDWAEMRWLGEEWDSSVDIQIAYARKPVRRFVQSIADEVDTEPRDAELEVVGDGVVITEHRAGRRAARKKAVTGIMRRLEGEGRRVNLRVDPLAPEVETSRFHQVLLLDQSEHRLTLLVDGQRTRDWIVAVGTGDYPTPLGRYSVTLKRHLPTWVNPSPDGWGSDMPESIPPGPGNPLGVRALNWDAPAIRFHGTQAVDSLGTDASHGCVRMSNADVTELYDLVDVGAVIISRQ